MRMRLEKGSALVVVLVLVMSVFVIGIGTVKGSGEMDGGVDDLMEDEPKEIHDWEELYNVRDDLDEDYILMDTLDNDTHGYDDYVDTDEGWNPIGDDDNPFTGTFNGNEHEISDLYIDRPNTDYVSLFGYVDDEGEVRNVGVVDADVSGDGRVGGLVGKNWDGTVENSYATGNVSGNDWVGGLMGDNSGTVANSYATGDVSGEWAVGGLVGRNILGTVENSFWDIETTGENYSDGGTGKTTTEMKDVATFTDTETEGLDEPWDFVGNPNDDEGDEDIWDIDDNEEINDGYPFLTWEHEEEDDEEDDDETDTYDLTITIKGEGSTDPEKGTHTYDEGDEVTVEATPDDGWYFEGWTGSYIGDELEIELEMDEDKHVTANFEEIGEDQIVLTVDVDGDGAVEPAGEQVYEVGEEGTFKVAEEYEENFIRWEGDVPEDKEEDLEITIEVDEDTTLRAVFEEEEDPDDEEDDDTPGFTSMILILGIIIAVAIYQKKKQ